MIDDGTDDVAVVGDVVVGDNMIHVGVGGGVNVEVVDEGMNDDIGSTHPR